MDEMKMWRSQTFFEFKKEKIVLGQVCLLSYFSEPYGSYNYKIVSGTKKIEEFKR